MRVSGGAPGRTAHRVRRAIGVDFAYRACQARRRMSFVEGPTTRNGATRTESFDAVLMISVLEHLSDAVRMLRGCCDWLRPGGVLLINVPTWRGKGALEYSAFSLGTSPKAEMDDHKMYYDKRDLWPLS